MCSKKKLEKDIFFLSVPAVCVCSAVFLDQFPLGSHKRVYVFVLAQQHQQNLIPLIKGSMIQVGGEKMCTP